MKIPRVFAKGLKSTGLFLGKPVNRALHMLSGVMGKSEERLSGDIILLLKAVIWADGKLEEGEIDGFRSYISSRHSSTETEKFIAVLKSEDPVDYKKHAKAVAILSENARLSILNALLEVAHSNDRYDDIQRKLITEICACMRISPELQSEAETQFALNLDRREKIVRSGTGIVVAMIILLIFVLTATFLKSVLFGLILAYFFLPFEKWYENHFFTNRAVQTILKIVMFPLSPFVNTGVFVRDQLSGKMRKHRSTEEIAELECKQRVGKACTATFVSVFIGIAILSTLLVTLTASYVTGIGNSVKNWADINVREQMDKDSLATDAKPVITNIEATIPESIFDIGNMDRKTYLKKLFGVAVGKLDSLKPQVERLPGFSWAKSKVSEYLKNEKNQEELLAAVLSKTGGVFTFSAGFLGNLLSFLLGLLLTLFFFTFFLQKFASFTSSGENSKLSPGEYLVSGIFTTSWFPHTSIETKTEAMTIINHLCKMLRTWVRGYLAIIFVETIIYVGVFMAIGVPYAIPLGIVAGCTVLLPFIGPLASAILTILVCFAGDFSITGVLVVVGVYGIINGIVEQLFLYPSLVGEGLGLNNLETIIVVLLGGLFGGLTGMIFAVPTAAILKYIIPQIYSCWQPEPQTPSS